MAYSFAHLTRNVLPAGVYKAMISEIKYKDSKDHSTHYNMEVHYTVVEGTYAKRTVVDTIYEAAFAFRLRPFLIATEIDMNREFETMEEMYNYCISQATGKTIMLTVGIRTYNGAEYNEVKDWSPVTGSKVTLDDVMKEFDAADSKEATMDFEKVSKVDDDDLPF